MLVECIEGLYAELEVESFYIVVDFINEKSLFDIYLSRSDSNMPTSNKS
jgi:hypothetical protein